MQKAESGNLPWGAGADDCGVNWRMRNTHRSSVRKAMMHDQKEKYRVKLPEDGGETR